MSALFLAVLVASVVGSSHCAGMCGCFAALATGTTSGGAGTRRLHAAYHGGRLATYVLLGVAAGGLGAALDLGGDLVGLQRAAAFLAGALLVLVGGAALLRQLGVRVPHTRTPGFWRRFVASAHRVAAKLGPTTRATTIGLASVLLPCGWLYAFVITAAGTGSPVLGAVVMAAFWAGSVPVLLSIGVGVRALRGLGRRAQIATSLLVVFVGFTTAFARVGFVGGPLSQETAAPAPSVEEAIERVESLDSSEMPCCDHD